MEATCTSDFGRTTLHYIPRRTSKSVLVAVRRCAPTDRHLPTIQNYPPLFPSQSSDLTPWSLVWPYQHSGDMCCLCLQGGSETRVKAEERDMSGQSEENLQALESATRSGQEKIRAKNSLEFYVNDLLASLNNYSSAFLSVTSCSLSLSP